MKYKGYTAKVAYEPGDRALHGRVIDIADTIHFQGQSVDELEQAFRDSVDDYLAMCAEDGVEPAKPYSGRLVLRMPSDLHHRVHVAAERQGISMNDLLLQAIERAIAA